jgi:hypothetical protein
MRSLRNGVDLLCEGQIVIRDRVNQDPGSSQAGAAEKRKDTGSLVDKHVESVKELKIK